MSLAIMELIRDNTISLSTKFIELTFVMAIASVCAASDLEYSRGHAREGDCLGDFLSYSLRFMKQGIGLR